MKKHLALGLFVVGLMTGMASIGAIQNVDAAENTQQTQPCQEQQCPPPPQQGPQQPKPENVTRTVELLENGARITITSDDAETVKHIQERAQKGPQHPPRPPKPNQGQGQPPQGQPQNGQPQASQPPQGSQPQGQPQ